MVPNYTANFDVNPPQVQNLLIHIASDKIVEIVEVNPKFGWFIVKFPGGEKRRYSSMGGSNWLFKVPTKEQIADYRLNQANTNVDDSWREY